MDVSYAVVAEFDGDLVPADQQIAVNNLLRRNEVGQVVWTRKAEPQRRPARPRPGLVATVLLSHAANDEDADQVARTLGGLGLVSDVRIERPSSRQMPVASVQVTPPARSRESDPPAR